MINELKYIMVINKLKKFSEYFDDLYELIDKWVEEKHSDNGETAYITGIGGFSGNNVEYSWACPGYSRGCCGYRSGEDKVSFDDLLTFIQGVN